ncbi:uncharacterized protein PAN0_003d1716 [Moesziomyces antarcticus]|uniref:Maintenance of telomere capping protein 1 n=1 Tax=Pseudozyma antarctica TaxID=84753 RepID=A0A5C3FI85_PSEA2|nr:uncharacterized protein PAN0_003d1716 [Moesziomyces antarcticus]GAK63511.1 conserved hypothetical protein [Moesziomyces antarcticus]SPO44098.1 uncharacterized protein PSANT_01783 [Moesziomyces antarcticus]
MSRRNRKDVDDLLADLDNLGTEAPTKPARKSADKGTATPTPATSDASAKKAPEDAQTLLDDLDSLMQSRANSSSRASQRKKDDSAWATTAAAVASAPPTASSEKATAAPTTSETTGSTDTAAVASSDEKAAAAGSSGGWSGWGSSLFSQATKLADQARQEFEKRAPTQAEQARELGSKGWDLAKGVRGFVKEAGLEKWGEEVTKVGKRGWTDIVNAVAPPIAAHEIIQVTLSHDMVGYDGISDVTYQTLAKVMEQVHSDSTEQQLVVNKAQAETASKPKETAGAEQPRDLNAVEGFAAAFRLARVSMDECIKQHEVAPPPQRSAEAAALPITSCPVFVRIQACLTDLPGDDTDKDGTDAAKSLFFIVLLRDPQHGLSHKTVSQAVPTSWLDVPFEENQWVEESLVDVLSNALSIVGQDYVQGRMSGRTKSSKEGLADQASQPTQPSA